MRGVYFECPTMLRLSALKREKPDPGSQHLLLCSTLLVEESRHGGHYGLEIDIGGSNLNRLQMTQPTGKFRLPVAKRLIRQTLLALQFLHEVVQVVHTGMFEYLLTW